MKKLFIIGSGVGDEEILTSRARQIINMSDRVLNSRKKPLKDLLKKLEEPAADITSVLVSGDCGFYSIAKTIIKDFSQIYDIELISGISSIQYFSAKLLISYDDAKIISLHGRSSSIIPYVAYNKKLFVLTGGKQKAHDICKLLCANGLHKIKVSIGERLSYSNERIATGTADKLSNYIFDDLSVMYIENEFAQNPFLPIKDEDFIRGDVPMTKEEVRYLSLQKLSIKQTDILYDIGAGTGSVSVEMARKAFEGFVYAIEMKDTACNLIEQNRQKHGAYNIKIINSKAPEGLDGLEIPNGAFIGGSAGNMDLIMHYLLEKNPKINIVINAVTLQSLNEAINAMKKYQACHVETICVNIAKSKKIGDYDMMMAQNPIYIINGRFGADI